MTPRSCLMPGVVLIALGMILGVVPSLQAQNLPSSLLWRVTKGQGAPSHLFGTIHVPDTSVFRQRDTALTLLASSTTFAAELDMDSAESMVDPSQLFLAQGTLYDLLDSASVREICSAITSTMPMLSPLCARLKPGAASVILTMANVKATTSTVMDRFLWDRAGELGIRRVGLESYREQKELLDGITADMLLEQVRDRGRDDSLMRELVAAYVREDLASLAAMGADTSLHAFDDMMDELNGDRNVTMTERMEPLLRSGRAFIAVGALHLTGDRSIIELLRARGYTVEPVMGGVRSMWIPSATR